MAFRKDCGIDDLYQLPCPATVEKIRMACNDKIFHKVRNCQSVVSLCSLSLWDKCLVREWLFLNYTKLVIIQLYHVTFWWGDDDYKDNCMSKWGDLILIRLYNVRLINLWISDACTIFIRPQTYCTRIALWVCHLISMWVFFIWNVLLHFSNRFYLVMCFECQ